MYEMIYGISALTGGTLLVCQFLLSLIGVGDHHDVGGGHDFHEATDNDGDHGHGGHGGQHNWFLSVLTLRSVAAALTFFGLTGLTSAVNLQHEPEVSLGLALLGGAAALFGVAYLMRMLGRLKADGTVHIERAVGRSGTVYLTIPGQKAGVGKVTLCLQNRTVECQAVTPYQQLDTGSKVVVTNILGPALVEVAPADQWAVLSAQPTLSSGEKNDPEDRQP